MKTSIKNLCLLPVLIAGLGLILAGPATAQTFTTLYSFTGGTGGEEPRAGLILSGNTLYGTTWSGGYYTNKGMVFKVNTDGTGFTTLRSFSGGNFDGANPSCDLTLSGNRLFGTTAYGGSSGNGTVFTLTTNGGGGVVHYFTNGDGSYPKAGLVLIGNTLYGTTATGGDYGYGTVFAVNADGPVFTNLYSFTGGNDGANPAADLVSASNTLYGTAGKGAFGRGTIFAVKTDGMGFTNLYSFTSTDLNTGTNSDGAGPGELTLSGNTLYGTASGGGFWRNGTVFKLNTDGTGFTNLHTFTIANGPPYPATNSDGTGPNGLILSGSTLYGTAAGGGSFGNGTVFKINSDGTGFSSLYSFSASTGTSSLGTPINSDGANPYARLIVSGNTGFTLQSATNLCSPVWSTNSPAPVIVNGQNTVTNPISGTPKFYRLIQ